MGLALFLTQNPRAFPQVPRSRVFSPVYPVTKAHDASAVVQNIATILGGVFRMADFQGHLHHFFGSPAMCGTFKDANAGDYCRMEVGYG